MEKSDAGSTRQKKKWSMMQPFIIAFIIVALLRLFVFTIIRVDGQSMETTLYTGENIIVEKLSYTFSQPRRFDVIVCKFAEHRKNYVKRIIGLPGETIEIKDGVIYINGAPLEGDSHANGYTEGFQPEIYLPEGHYFVLGDNRTNSSDSIEMGPVAKGDILGRGFAIIWPLNKMEMLTD